MKKNVDTSLGNFLQIINSLLEKQIQIEKQKQIPLKQITKKEIKAKTEPWITTGILTSIWNKNKICNKCFKTKYQERKDLRHQQFRNYRNILSNLTKKSKGNFHKEYFQENKYNLMKVWQGIKDIIFIKNITENSPPFWK